MPMNAVAQAFTEVSTTQKHWPLGDEQVNNADGFRYRYVKLQNTTATVATTAGFAVAYDATAADGTTVVSDVDDATTKPICAGFAAGAAAGVLATAYYMWVQVSGTVTLNKEIGGTEAEGDAVFLTTTDDTLTLATAVDDPVCGYVLDLTANVIVLNISR